MVAKKIPLLPIILLGLLNLIWLTSCRQSSPALLRPNGVAVAADGTLLVMSRGGNQIVHLSPTGQILNTFGHLGIDPNDIYSGWDIDLDAAENIYICNHTRDEVGSFRPRDEVKVFTPAGDFLENIGQQNYTGEETSNTPYGLDIDTQGRLYVADFDADTIRVFTAQGGLAARFNGTDGPEAAQFKTPVDVAVDDQRNLLYVVDPFNSRIQQYQLTTTPSGQLTLIYRLSLGTYGHEPGQFAYPQNIVVDDSSGRIYVADMGNRRIQVFDSQGKFLNQFSAPGNWQVMGLDIGPDGVIYATDAFNNVIWVFEPDGRVRQRLEVTS
jgi:DNA-binding beta-propeller fold protein YncE